MQKKELPNTFFRDKLEVLAEYARIMDILATLSETPDDFVRFALYAAYLDGVSYTLNVKERISEERLSTLMRYVELHLYSLGEKQ